MRYTFGFILFFVTLTSFGQVNEVDSQGRKQGPWMKVYEGTRVFQYKGQFKNDKPVGKFSYFYKTGKLKAIIEHTAGSNRSVGYYYHAKGGLMSYGIYRNLKKDSIWTTFDRFGKVSGKETYKNDSLHGQKVIYFPPDEESRNQVVSSVSNYVNGSLEGDYIEYFINRSVREKGTYKNNKKHGVWISYQVGGAKMMLTRYKEGKRHGWCLAYDKLGKEQAKKYFYYGRHLEGKELAKKMKQMKELGIHPNE
ncbi:MAG: hypothetical protein MK066_06480 [Crocinitomicaceae bacterium]|nr:hypothetical protein [Crocinitomicaceae bacterium]